MLLTSSVVSAESSSDILNQSPIKKVYATMETVFFLHEDTSVSGFGSNIADILGQPNGEGNNTGELFRVSEPTGFEELIPGRQQVFGLRPVHEKDTYEVYKFDRNIGNLSSRYKTDFEVKDISMVGLSSGWTHQQTMYIDEQGFVRTRGSDYYEQSGIGSSRPFGPYPASGAFVIDKNGDWNKVLATDGQDIIYPTSGTDWFVSNEDNSGSDSIVITPAFDIVDERFTIESRLRDFAQHPTEPRVVDEDDSLLKQVVEIYDGNLTDAEILSGNHTPLKTINRMNNRSHSETRYNRAAYPVDLDHISQTKFKLKITTAYVKWDLRLRERKYFKNAVKVSYRMSGGYFAIVDANKDVFINRNTPVVQKVNFPVDVEVVPETLNNDGEDTEFAIIDKRGRVWTFLGTSPSMVMFPDIDGVPFYDNYKINKVSSGHGFMLAISEHRTTGETNVWAWGSNNDGKLGLEGVSVGDSVSPTLVTRSGEAITNIQDVSAGLNFSIIVQNTNDGQLVWSAGKNDKGQLGGGIKLLAEVPQLIPGLSNIDRVTSRNNYSYALNDTEKIMYRFGGNVSYISEYSFSSALGYPQHLFPSYYPYWHFIGENGIARHDITGYNVGGTTSSYGPLQPWYGEVFDSNGNDINIDFRATYNQGISYFLNPKSILSGVRQGNLIDENGRLWSYGGTNWMGSYTGRGPWYNINGTQANHRGVIDDEPAIPGRNFAWPAKFNQDTYAEPIFEFLVGPTYTSNSISSTYAIDFNGKLWYTNGYYTTRISSTWDVDSAVIVEGFSGIFRHAFLLDQNGEIWGYGYGGSGRKGTGNSTNTRVPQKIDKSYFNNEKIIHASAGVNHSLFVTETGDVYAVGGNDYRKLGFGEVGLSYDRPQKVEGISNVKFVHAGKYFSLAIDDQNRVWGWGYIAGGSLGNNFPISRAFHSTAAGNDLLSMTTENDVKDIYLSANGNDQFTMYGMVSEPEQEKTRISIDILGIEKEYIIESSTWLLDIYDETIAQPWELTWHASEFTDGQLQNITTINAEDIRGGLMQQFFSGSIIVDNEAPQTPIWGDTCVLDRDGNEVSCYVDKHFNHQSGNPVDTPIRIYMVPTQKTGENKAPVKVEYQYRKYHPYGYTNDWSDWKVVNTKNENGHYQDFFEGFLGEYQIRMRAVDEAGNVSGLNSDTRYTQISNAGAEVDSVIINPNSSQEKGLFNELEIEGTTPDNSDILSYSIQRKKFDSSNETEWVDLSDGRQTWVSLDTTMTFVDDDVNLNGNARYTYKVDLENSIAIGAPKETAVITNPYEPKNFSRVPTDEGLNITLRQNEANEGEILYRMVIVEASSGSTYSLDKISSNTSENLFFEFIDAQMPFSIVNNKIDIMLIMRGENGKYVTIVYDEGYVNSPAISEDITPPNVTMNLGRYSELLSTDELLIDFSIFASDDTTAPESLQTQISKDGNAWFGLTDNGSWVKNHWGRYSTKYYSFDVSDVSGRQLIYVRVRDGAGNMGYTSQEIFIAQPVERDETQSPIDTDATRTPNENNHIPVNTNYINLQVPKTGDLVEVQFSFDGVTWSGWEVIDTTKPRSLTLPPGEGHKSIYTRYRNTDESATRLTENDIIQYILDYTPPNVKMNTMNGTRITKNSGIALLSLVSDNFSNKIELELVSNSLSLVTVEGGVATTHDDKEVTLQKNIQKEIHILGLNTGFNQIHFIVRDEAGNEKNEKIVVFRK